ncbi:MAG TPA: LLM class flavin-dependent oxidoreductase [Burkholderiales bacterium]|nr:LLM class flavin-dependent oxidoreductase [Burkholderiales bacterium]
MPAFPESPLEFGIFDWIEASGAPASEIFEHKLDLAQAADAAGFYALHIAEHQGTPLSIDGSPALVLAAAIQRTHRLRLGALTFCLPWYDPFRFYNEVCMLDQMSGGRLELGVGRGISPIESSYYGIGSVEESRERYREALDIFFAACGSTLLGYAGKYHSYRDLELQLKPLQRPYPPLWFPSSDRNSIDFTARHGYHTVLNTSNAEAASLYARYREVWVEHRDDPGRHNAHVAAPKLGKSQHVYVADTEAEALETGLAAYRVWGEHLTHLTRRHGRPNMLNVDPTSPDAPMRLTAGTPRSVAQQLEDMVRTTGINYLLVVLSYGNLRAEQAMRSMQLFVREVMPALRKTAPTNP